MEVDGKEFMRNVGIEQDKERLAREQKRLEALKREAYLREEEAKSSPQEAAFVDLSLNSQSPSSDNTMNESTIEDLKLEQGDPNAQKKKYILLGIALILIFVITILIIRLISNSDTEQKMENLNPQHKKEVATDNILNKIDTNEEYQKAIDKNLAKEESKKLDEAKKSAVPDMGLTEEKVENTPLVIEKPKPKELKKDLFGLTEKKETTQDTPQQASVKKTTSEPTKAIDNIYKKIEEDDKAQEIVTKKVKTETSVFTPKKVETPKKQIVKPTPKKPVAKANTATKVSGYYIQIGAFTKQPSDQFLNGITTKGFSYVIHPTVVKGKNYNKVLIGPYPTRKAAQNNLNNVKQKLKKSGAYILKF